MKVTIPSHPALRPGILGLTLLLLCLVLTGCATSQGGISFIESDGAGHSWLPTQTTGILYEIKDDSLSLLCSDASLATYNPRELVFSPGTSLEKGATVAIVTRDQSFLAHHRQENTLRVLSPPSTFTLAAIADHKIDAAIDAMTLEEKVGQLLYVRTPPGDAAAIQKKYQFGGYLLFSQDIDGLDAKGLKDKIASFQKNADIPMFIGVDEEGGEVVRVSDNPLLRSTPFSSPQALLAAGGLKAVGADTLEKDTLLKRLGFNMNFAPVCDLSQNPEDYIYSRTTGLNEDRTAEYVKTVVTQMKNDTMASVLKHFPGYGSNGDTHQSFATDNTDFATDNTDLEMLLTKNMTPFEAGIESGCSVILFNHTVITAIDAQNPASLSPKVHLLLRKSLDYHGLITTDALDMAAIEERYQPGEAAVAAIAVAVVGVVIQAAYEYIAARPILTPY